MRPGATRCDQSLPGSSPQLGHLQTALLKVHFDVVVPYQIIGGVHTGVHHVRTVRGRQGEARSTDILMKGHNTDRTGGGKNPLNQAPQTINPRP